MHSLEIFLKTHIPKNNICIMCRIYWEQNGWIKTILYHSGLFFGFNVMKYITSISYGKVHQIALKSSWVTIYKGIGLIETLIKKRQNEQFSSTKRHTKIRVFHQHVTNYGEEKVFWRRAESLIEWVSVWECLCECVRARFVINAPFCYKSQKLSRFVINLAPFCYKPCPVLW